VALEILLHPDPRLRERCAEIDLFDDKLAEFVTQMFEAMYEAPGRGLAAPQVGLLERLFVMDAGWKDGTMIPKVLCNPQITARATTHVTNVEACLSIPDRSRAVSRPNWVKMRWQGLDGSEQTGRFEGIEAVCAQHELDHLDGKLILDHPRSSETH
jgi:peptide deformylase